LGIDLGSSFRTLQEAHRDGGHVVARLELPAARTGDLVAWAHPGLLDGALQSVGLALPETDGSAIYLFSGVERVRVWATLPAELWCDARLRPSGHALPSQWSADVTLRDRHGAPLGELQGVSLRRTTREALRQLVLAPTASSWFYEVQWEELPAVAPAADGFEHPQRLERGIREQFDRLARANGMSIYDALLPELDRLSTALVGVALRDLAFDETPGRQFELDREAATLRIADRHRRLFARLMEMLVEDGILQRRGDSFEVAGELPYTDVAAGFELALARFGDVDGELRTLQRCGGSLARVLTGSQDPLQLLFPGGSLVEARKLYVESPYARTYSGALAEALRAFLATRAPGRRLRVLEIGAGTGGTTSYVLPLLPKDGVEYTFTDLSPHFLDAAATRFAEYPFVRRAVLDIESDPTVQGFQDGRYDVVIAANVLHATADLRKTLEHAGKLMTSEGLLLLLEGVAPERWVDLTFGLTDGWWRFTDDGLRPNYPLIGREAWLGLLQSVGFAGAIAVPGNEAALRRSAPQALIVARAPVRRRRWAIVGDVPDVSSAIADQLSRRGDAVATITAAEVRSAALDADEVVYLGALLLSERDRDDARASDECREMVSETTLDILPACSQPDSAARVWLVTRGALPAAGTTAAGARWQAPLWGLGRVFALEQPTRSGGLIDLDPDVSGASLASQLLGVIDADDGEDQVAIRGGRRLAARLTAASRPAARITAPVVRPDGTYLVTGGYGGLGTLVARWMVDQGARTVALLGRTPGVDDAGIRDLEARGARVLRLQGDVADEQRMAEVFRDLDAQAPPLRGIVHAAADLSVAAIGELRVEQVTAMLRPKVDGTLILERMARTRQLDFVVLFSSSTALLGAAGFAHYAAANLFLDATAATATGGGCRVISVNWGTWDVMRLASAADQRGFRSSGLRPMSSAAALSALADALRSHTPNVMVADIDWSVLKPLHEARRERPFLSRMAAPPATDDAAPQTSGAALVERWCAAPAEMRRDVLLAFVGDEVAAVLGLDRREPVPLETGLFELGMDSLMSVELRRRLEHGVGQQLPSTLTFNYPNVNALATFIDRQLQSSLREPAPVAPTVAAPIAVTGSEHLAELTDEELEARLLARLEQAR
jgi:SAM-dependent methyltransferase/NAD(P)-dependent dehydrogenase (short-subunit alcohol dehydrogenase family)/acyl carrier protein